MDISMNATTLKNLEVASKAKIKPDAKLRASRYVGSLEMLAFVMYMNSIEVEGLEENYGLDQDIVKRILYYRGQGIFWQYGSDPRLYYTPYALKGNIDIYGRFKATQPYTFNGTYKMINNKPVYKDDVYIQDLQLPVFYDVYSVKKAREAGHDFTTGDWCVILRDYDNGISQFTVPMSTHAQAYIDDLNTTLVLMRTDLITSVKTYFIVCHDEHQSEAVKTEMAGVLEDIVEGKVVHVVTDDKEMMRELFSKAGTPNAQAYWECFSSQVNNLKNLLGVVNSGVFQKKERKLEGEQDTESQESTPTLTNRIKQWNKSLEILNEILGSNIRLKTMDPKPQEGGKDDGDNDSGRDIPGSGDVSKKDTLSEKSGG